MIRPVLIELTLFLVPFVLYALFLWGTQRGGVFDRTSWPLPHLVGLVIAAFVLVLASFIVLAQWGGAPPGSTYTPAHMEDGRFVPGQTKR